MAYLIDPIENDEVKKTQNKSDLGSELVVSSFFTNPLDMPHSGGIENTYEKSVLTKGKKARTQRKRRKIK